LGGFGWGDGFFDTPSDVAIDKDKYLYVADTRNNRVQKLDEYGKAVVTFGKYGEGDGEFHGPKGMAVDDNYIYVSDTGNNRVQIFDKNGKYLTKFGKTGSGKGEFNNPMGMTTGKAHQLFIADTNNHRIVELKLNL